MSFTVPVAAAHHPHRMTRAHGRAATLRAVLTPVVVSGQVCAPS